VTRELEGSNAVVTGAGGGLGRAVAGVLAARGARVVAVGRTEGSLAAVCDAVRRDGGHAESVVADVGNPTDVERVFAACDRVDVLVNCAGVQLRKPALEIEPAEWDELMRVDLTGVFLMCRAAAALLARKGGAIVNITSLTDTIGLPNLAAYAAAKGGVAQLTKVLAVEWAAVGIRVNAVAPGRVRTPMTEDVFARDDVRASFEACIPQGRAGTPEEIAEAVAFLASSRASYITGQTLYVDGGWLAAGGGAIA
jgi:NAD(P)-dependent dehydrogenase (short-subunit alcohol dehydrogenase family)